MEDQNNVLSRRQAKEAFVSGLVGTSKQEVFALVATLSMSIVVYEQCHLSGALGVGLELLLVVYPQLLLCTGALPLWPTFMAYCTPALAGCFWAVLRPGSPRRLCSSRLEDLTGTRKTFVSSFRGALMLATCTAILAVDFRAFPRGYAKTETYGTGYMDVGVGGVILAAGLVSPAALPYTAPSGAQSGRGDGGGRRPAPLWRRLYVGFRGAAACWVLGTARLFTTRAVDYQAHVGEYGVHWNFFHTIALVALLGQAAAGALPPGALAPAALAATALHQVALSLGGLGPWVMSPERGPDLLSLNKEGLVSAAGFAALYLWGAALAHAMHAGLQRATRHLQRQQQEQAQKEQGQEVRQLSGLRAGAVAVADADAGGAESAGAAPPAAAAAAAGLTGDAAGEGDGPRAAGGGEQRGWRARLRAAAPLLRWWLRLAALDAALWGGVVALEARVERVSRRSCNAAYIVWIAAQCLAGLLPLALWQALDAAASAGPPVHSDGGGDGGHGSGVGGGDARRHGAAAGQRAGAEPAEAAAGASARASAGAAPGPRVLLAINRNQLPVFLFANVLTGLVNLSVNTLQVPDAPARLLLGAYITCVCGVALLLDARGWRLKL